MQNSWKTRLLSLSLVGVMLFSTACGGDKTQTDTQTSSDTSTIDTNNLTYKAGFKEETQIIKDANGNNVNLIQMITKPDGAIEAIGSIYAPTDDVPATPIDSAEQPVAAYTFATYILQDGQWIIQDETAPWMKLISDQNGNLTDVAFDKDGNQYVLYTAPYQSDKADEAELPISVPYVAKVTADGQLEEIAIEWKTIAYDNGENHTSSIVDMDIQKEVERVKANNAENNSLNATTVTAESVEIVEKTAEDTAVTTEAKETAETITDTATASTEASSSDDATASDATDEATESDISPEEGEMMYQQYLGTSFVPYLTSIEINSNSEIIVLGYDYALQYDVTGKYMADYLPENNGMDFVFADDKLYVGSYGDAGEILSQYNTLDPKQSPNLITTATTISPSSGMQRSQYLSDGKTLYATGTSLLKYDVAQETWVAATSNTINMFLDMTTNYISIATDGTNYYLLGNGSIDESGYASFILSLVYGEDAVVEPVAQLKIYSLNGTYSLQSALTRFRIAHPEIDVTIETGLDYTSDVEQNEQDIINKLNTQILAGEGPDIFLLDGLPLDSYMSQGVLADLTQYVDENIEKNGWSSTVAKSLSKDGNIYALPSGMQVPVILGKKSTLEQIKTMDDLVAWAKANPTPPLFYDNYPMSILYNLMPLGMNNFVKEDGGIDTTELAKFLTQVKEIWQADTSEPLSKERRDEQTKSMQQYSEAGETVTFDYPLDSLSDFAFSDVQFIIDNYNMTNSAGYVRAAVKKRGDDYTYSYLPAGDKKLFVASNVLGVNANSKHQDACLMFLDEVLNNASTSAMTGYATPLNLNLLMPSSDSDANSANTINDVTYAMGDSDGRMLEYTDKLTKEQAQTLIDFYSQANAVVPNNYQISSAIIDQAPAFFAGTITAEEVAKKVEENLLIYLNE